MKWGTLIITKALDNPISGQHCMKFLYAFQYFEDVLNVSAAV